MLGFKAAFDTHAIYPEHTAASVILVHLPVSVWILERVSVFVCVCHSVFCFNDPAGRLIDLLLR